MGTSGKSPGTFRANEAGIIVDYIKAYPKTDGYMFMENGEITELERFPPDNEEDVTRIKRGVIIQLVLSGDIPRLSLLIDILKYNLSAYCFVMPCDGYQGHTFLIFNNRDKDFVLTDEIRADIEYKWTYDNYYLKPKGYSKLFVFIRYLMKKDVIKQFHTQIVIL